MIIFEDSKTLFCFSKFPWARERSSRNVLTIWASAVRKFRHHCPGHYTEVSGQFHALAWGKDLLVPETFRTFLEKRESACPGRGLKFCFLANEPVKFALLPGLSILCLLLTVVWTCKSHTLLTCIPDRFWNRYPWRSELSGLALELVVWWHR